MRISGQKISATDIQHIINLGKSLLEMPIELLPGVKDTLKALKEKGKCKLVVATKGDLLDQENKLERSGLASYFDHMEVMWKHEVVDTFTHAHLKQLKRFDELLTLF